jgi:hypothetical protein
LKLGYVGSLKIETTVWLMKVESNEWECNKIVEVLLDAAAHSEHSTLIGCDIVVNPVEHSELECLI